METNLDKQLSVHVSRALNFLGKSQNMIKYRVKMYREIQRHTCTISDAQEIIVSGSKGEGLTAWHESDYDRMYVIPEVICADNTQDFIDTRHTTLFQTKRHDAPAGYTKLKLVKCDRKQFGPLIQHSLFLWESGDRYLSSDFFAINLAKCFDPDGHLNHHERTGPSLDCSSEDNIHLDVVPALFCVCLDLLQAFINRPRLYNRPARNILNDISKLESHVVPVGYKGSNTSYQQWRICYTKAELHLVQSLNDTETKLYILLKMVSNLLKSISKDITSYVMKNIVLWLVELYSVSMFTEELLTTRLIQALNFLKKCVEANYLPNYMIPERNLFDGRLDQTQRHKLNIALSSLIYEGGCQLLRCEKLKMAMLILYREPDMAVELRWRKDIIERSNFLSEIWKLEKLATTGFPHQQVRQMFLSDEKCAKLSMISLIALLPDMEKMVEKINEQMQMGRGFVECFYGSVMERRIQWLS